MRWGPADLGLPSVSSITGHAQADRTAVERGVFGEMKVEAKLALLSRVTFPKLA